jgi:phosphoglycerate dehydrogenase-like enzyme
MNNRAAERPATASSPSTPLADIYVPEVEAVQRMAVERFLTERGYQPRCGDALMAPGPEILAEAIGSADIVAVALGNVDATVMDADPDLRLIVKCGIGVDCIDVDAARERDIPVIRMGGVNFNGVAEWVIGAAIANLRRFVQLDGVVRAGEWREERDRWTGLLPGLPGRTLGLFGVGSIGSRVAELARVHGMHVIGFDPYLSEDAARSAGVELVDRDELFERSDVVSVHAILTDETRHAVSTAELELMRESAILVNSARGPIVDEAALVEALRAGAIAGAALDVFELEPVPSDSPLLTMDNCLLSPHLAGCTDIGYHEIGGLAAKLIDDFVQGAPIPANCVVVPGRDLLVDDGVARSR